MDKGYQPTGDKKGTPPTGTSVIEPKPMVTYCLYIKTINGITTHYIYDYQYNYGDLIENYKNALLRGNACIVWDNGVLDVSNIVGIVKQ